MWRHALDDPNTFTDAPIRYSEQLANDDTDEKSSQRQQNHLNHWKTLGVSQSLREAVEFVLKIKG
jgi:hypothetical protein